LEDAVPLANQIKSAIRPVYTTVLSAPFLSGLARSRPAFDRVRRRYFSEHPMRTKRDVRDPALAELLANGVAVLPGYFDSVLTQKCHDKAFEALELVRQNRAPEEWETVRYVDDGIYRLKRGEKVVPEIASILDDERLLTITREYLGYPIRGRSNYIDYKPDFGKHDNTTVPHMDSWMSQIKIFTLLKEVSPLTAPLVYWKRSHVDADWRREFDYQHFRATYVGSAGICPPGVLRNRCGPAGELEEVTVTGPAGTVVIADVRGFHRASNVFAGYRLEVVQKITIEMP
jgi:hypothetical protein